MRKWIVALLALALLAPGALAVGRNDAASIAREATGGAEIVRVERDDGVYEVELRGDGARYQVEILERDGSILEIETAYAGAGGATSFDLSEDEARAAAAQAAPEAAGGIVTRERGAQGAVYEVFYSSIGAVGEIAINAENGAIVGTRTYPRAAARGALSAERISEILAERLPGAQIAELELDWDGGRYVLDGEAEANGQRYSFELDAGTGAILEFERDD